LNFKTQYGQTGITANQRLHIYFSGLHSLVCVYNVANLEPKV